MTDLRKAAEMALKVLENSLWYSQARIREIKEALRQALAQPEQKPVAWIKKDRSAIEVSIMSADYMKNEGFEPLYTAPPKREWVGLTDQEVFEIHKNGYATNLDIRAVEAKLKQKNT